MNRLDKVKLITVEEFKKGVEQNKFQAIKQFTAPNDTLHYDEEKGGVFVWSQTQQKYFLVGKER